MNDRQPDPVTIVFFLLDNHGRRGNVGAGFDSDSIMAVAHRAEVGN